MFVFQRFSSLTPKKNSIGKIGVCWPVLALATNLQIRDLSRSRKSVRPVDRHNLFFPPVRVGCRAIVKRAGTPQGRPARELAGAFPRTGRHDTSTSAVACFPVRLDHLDVKTCLDDLAVPERAVLARRTSKLEVPGCATWG